MGRAKGSQTPLCPKTCWHRHPGLLMEAKLRQKEHFLQRELEVCELTPRDSPSATRLLRAVSGECAFTSSSSGPAQGLSWLCWCSPAHRW